MMELTKVRNYPYPARFAKPSEWFERAFYRQDRAILGALAATWTALPLALSGALLGAVAGAVVGVLGVGAFGHILGSFVENQGFGVLGAAIGAVAGMVIGFGFIYFYLVIHPIQLAGALLGGAIVSGLALLIIVAVEPLILDLRGYRKLSRREGERIYPLLKEVAQKMGIDVVPALLISDSLKPGAWTHMRAVVVTRGLLGDYDASEKPPRPDLDDKAVAAILGHELHHWAEGDAVALMMITVASFPLVFLLNAVAWVRMRAEWVGVVLYAFIWPVWVCSRFVIVPLMSAGARNAEYEADAAVAQLGDEYRLALRRALDELSAWERPRTGWEDVVTASHPPIEERMERLEAAGTDSPPPAPLLPAADKREG
jgi:Zn-dependent protease with chaperone function